MKKPIQLHSPAKVNLFLEVLGKRPDGYHEIVTVMQEVSLFDHLEIKEKHSGINIKTDPPILPADRRNLVYRAAELFKKRYGIKQGVSINISKHIPIGGGLGGGSSNAAYTLKGLNQLWKLGLSDIELSLLASELGSDVPFFIYGHTCLCKGRGEIVFPLSLKPYFHYLIVYPGFPVPTKNIYKNIKLGLTNKDLNINILANNQKNFFFNRLEGAAFKLYPVLRGIKEVMVGCGLKRVMLSGSGSSLFGVVNSRKEGNEVTKRIREKRLSARTTPALAGSDRFAIYQACSL